MVHVREMHSGDILAVYDLERLTFPFPFPESYIAYVFFQNPDLCLVLEVEDDLEDDSSFRLIGFILGGRTKFESEAHILSFAINQLFRKRGYGEFLLSTFISKVKEKGFKSIKLEVRESNISAIRLYEKLGFVKVKTIRKYYEDGENAYLYRLTIK